MPQLATLLIVVALGLGLLILGGGLFSLIRRAMVGYYALKPQDPPQPGDYGLDQSGVATTGPGAAESDTTLGAENG